MRIAALAFFVGLVACLAGGQTVVKTVTVNEYFGVAYDREPVSFDVAFPEGIDVRRLDLTEDGKAVPVQAEVLEGAPDKATRVRLWTTVSFPHVTDAEGKARPAPGAQRHKVFDIVRLDRPRTEGKPAMVVTPAEKVGQVETAVVSASQVGLRFAARVPVGSVTFSPAAPAFELPGPVVAVSRDGSAWVGSGYLDAMARVESIRCTVVNGPVYFESDILYTFEGGRTYRSRVRLFPSKPYAQLVEDFNVGGAARYVFNYDDWKADGFFHPRDQRLVNWEPIDANNPCGDFVQIEGQKALGRMVIWSQFNYFGGKQETIALKQADPQALVSAQIAAQKRYDENLFKYLERKTQYEQAVQEYQKQLAEYRKDPTRFRREPQAPKEFREREPTAPEKFQWEDAVYALAGAAAPTSKPLTPGGDATAVGAFYIRPDLWTRAKVNHVDLYMRPEVPGDRMTRGVVGLAGAKLRSAMEAWLVDGHREWAIFATRAGDDTFFAKAHVQEGVWPLDRLNRITLVWNSDGSPVKPEATVPADVPVGGVGGNVLLGTGGRSGLQFFNGSNGQIRWKPPTDGFDGKVQDLRAAAGANSDMVNAAITCYMASDDSAYPSIRAMLPWTDPEAINPFYQGMENMNFNADLYRYIAGHAVRLLKMGHPEGDRFLTHSEKSFDRALSHYVYPESGCWEESHGYAGHTIGVTGPLALLLKNSGRKNFLDDIRYARMAEFFLYTHSPVDREFGFRIVPPVGDHGLKKDGPASRFKESLELFSQSDDPDIRTIVSQMAWMVEENGGSAPEGVTPARPDLSSRWLRGYGTVLRGWGDDVSVWRLELVGALQGPNEGDKRSDLLLSIPVAALEGEAAVSGSAPAYNRGSHRGTATGRRTGESVTLAATMTVGDDRWVKGGQGAYTITMKKQGRQWVGTYQGTFNGRALKGDVRGAGEAPESFAVLRAGQSWGHHHEDKGSLWFWGRGVHFFGDCSWGGPPGGTYWNPFKQGPASGTQIELVGITNWTLPCKYAAPWISDERYDAEAGYDYANARCMYPFNPRLDVAQSTPVALRNGYDRQVLFVHPDVLIVRDNVEANCPTVWRLHSYQKETTKVQGASATLASPQGIVGNLRMVYPDGVRFAALGEYPPINPFTGEPHGDSGKPFSSLMLEWKMPAETSATWAFAVNGPGQAQPKVERLDDQGRVTRVTLADGTQITALLNITPFTYTSGTIDFEGTVGLVVTKDGKTTAHPIRAQKLEAQ